MERKRHGEYKREIEGMNENEMNGRDMEGTNETDEPYFVNTRIPHFNFTLL